MADYSKHHDKDSSPVFDSIKVLDVNLQYEKENILNKWTQQPSVDELKNTHVKKNNQTNIILTKSRDFTTPIHQISAYVPSGGSGIIQLPRTATPDLCSSSPSTLSTSNSCRFHPNQQYSVTESSYCHRNSNISLSSPQKCKKCGFLCVAESELKDHICDALLSTPIHDLVDHGDTDIKIDPDASQAGTFHLSVHKFQVHKPPPMPQEHPVSPLMSWVNNVPEKERFHPRNSRGFLFPDCYGNGSTTIVTPANHSDQLSHQQPTTYQYSHIRQLVTNRQQQMSSTRIPMVLNHQTQNKILKPCISTRNANDSQQMQRQQEPHQLLNNHFLLDTSNMMVGPSEVTRCMRIHTMPYGGVMSSTPIIENVLPFDSANPQVNTSNISGNLNVLDIRNYLLEPGNPNLIQDQLQLPSSSQIQQNDLTTSFSSLHPIVNPSNSNLGRSSPDQISYNFDSIYLPESPSGDSYSLENITPSIDGKFFNSPSSNSNSGGSNNNDNNEATSYTMSSSPDVLSSGLSTRTENTFMMNRFKLKNTQFPDDSLSSNKENSPPMTEPRVKTPTPTFIHKCFDCDKVFNKACYLTQHIKSLHSGVKPYKCERCGKSFREEFLHLNHLKKHFGDKLYKCDMCPKQFNHKIDLKRHMFLHTGNKPYTCDYCGKGFIRKDHMVRHCETHKRRPSLKCCRSNILRLSN